MTRARALLPLLALLASAANGERQCPTHPPETQTDAAKATKWRRIHLVSVPKAASASFGVLHADELSQRVLPSTDGSQGGPFMMTLVPFITSTAPVCRLTNVPLRICTSRGSHVAAAEERSGIARRDGSPRLERF